MKPKRQRWQGFSLPLKIRDEAIGKLILQGVDANDSESVEIANVVAERLSAHIEGLRLALGPKKPSRQPKSRLNVNKHYAKSQAQCAGQPTQPPSYAPPRASWAPLWGDRRSFNWKQPHTKCITTRHMYPPTLCRFCHATNENRYVPSVESSNGDDGGNKWGQLYKKMLFPARSSEYSTRHPLVC